MEGEKRKGFRAEETAFEGEGGPNRLGALGKWATFPPGEGVGCMR